jgi:hypothetical protein
MTDQKSEGVQMKTPVQGGKNKYPHNHCCDAETARMLLAKKDDEIKALKENLQAERDRAEAAEKERDKWRRLFERAVVTDLTNRERIAALEAALKPFALAADEVGDNKLMKNAWLWKPSRNFGSEPHGISVADVMKAKEALSLPASQKEQGPVEIMMRAQKRYETWPEEPKAPASERESFRPVLHELVRDISRALKHENETGDSSGYKAAYDKALAALPLGMEKRTCPFLGRHKENCFCKGEREVWVKAKGAV